MTKNVRSFRTMLRLFPAYQQPCLHISSEPLLNRPLLPRLPLHLSFRSPSPGFRSLIGTWWLSCPCGPSDSGRNAHQGHPRRATSVHWEFVHWKTGAALHLRNKPEALCPLQLHNEHCFRQQSHTKHL